MLLTAQFIKWHYKERNNHVVSHEDGTDAQSNDLAWRVTMNDVNWYALQNTPNISQQKLILENIVSRAATELTYNKSSYTKYVTTVIIWFFELDVKSGFDFPIYLKVGF